MPRNNLGYGIKKRTKRQGQQLADARARTNALRAPHQESKENTPVISRTQLRLLSPHLPKITAPDFFAGRKLRPAQSCKNLLGFSALITPNCNDQNPSLVSFSSINKPLPSSQTNSQHITTQGALRPMVHSSPPSAPLRSFIIPEHSSPCTPSVQHRFPPRICQPASLLVPVSDSNSVSTHCSSPGQLQQPTNHKRPAKFDSSQSQASAGIKKLKEANNLLRKRKDQDRQRVRRSVIKINKLEANLQSLQSKLEIQRVENRVEAVTLRTYKQKAEQRAEHAKRQVEDQYIKLTSLQAKLRASKIFNERLDASMEQRIEAAVRDLTTPDLREAGKWTERTRTAIRNLYNAGCPFKNIGQVIRMCAELLGVSVPGVPSPRTAGRVIIEGGIIAEIQIVFEFMNVNCKLRDSIGLKELTLWIAFVLAGDGTSLKHINYEAATVYMKAPAYSKLSANSSEDEIIDLTVRSARFLGVHATSSHTAEVQHNTLLDVITTMCNAYNSLPSRQKSNYKCACVEDIFLKYTGQVTDHAADQKKLFRIRVDYKARLWAKRLAEDRWELLADDEIIEIVETERRLKLEAAGGLEAWDAMAKSAQEELETKTRAVTMARLAEEGLAALPEEEQMIVRLCIWSGCASHKGMNIFKAGEKRMHGSWQDGDDLPAKLFNKDNLAAIADLIDPGDEDDPGYGDVQRRAIAVTDSGGHKVTSLAGGVFNHKDKKKGQQETYRTYMEIHTGSRKPVADTSNNRYASHGDAASDLIVHHATVIKFLEHVRDVKQEMTWTNMEANVHKGLMCKSTMTELCTMSIFSVCFFHPWLRHARYGEVGLAVNGLDEGPWYEKAMEFLGSVIQSPEIILGDTTYSIATLDARPWTRLDAILAVRQLAPTLPHLRRCTIAFFRGALDACATFLQEYAAEGAIDQATPEEREVSYRPATNDRSEGQLARKRKAEKSERSQSTLVHNASNMYACNDTAGWHALHMASQDNEAQEEFGTAISKEARRREESGESRAVLRKIVLEQERKAEVNRIVQRAKFEAEEREKQRVAKITREIDPTWPGSKGVTIPKLKEQLLAYRLFFKDSKLGKLSANKPELVKVLTGAIQRALDIGNARAPGASPSSGGSAH